MDLRGVTPLRLHLGGGMGVGLTPMVPGVPQVTAAGSAAGAQSMPPPLNRTMRSTNSTQGETRHAGAPSVLARALDLGMPTSPGASEGLETLLGMKHDASIEFEPNTGCPPREALATANWGAALAEYEGAGASAGAGGSLALGHTDLPRASSTGALSDGSSGSLNSPVSDTDVFTDDASAGGDNDVVEDTLEASDDTVASLLSLMQSPPPRPPSPGSITSTAEALASLTFAIGASRPISPVAHASQSAGAGAGAAADNTTPPTATRPLSRSTPLLGPFPNPLPTTVGGVVVKGVAAPVVSRAAGAGVQ